VPFSKESTVTVCHAGSDKTGFVEKANSFFGVKANR
jgi:hypothetical protein